MNGNDNANQNQIAVGMVRNPLLLECLTGRLHMNTRNFTLREDGDFCLLLMEKKRLKGAIKIS